MKPVVPANWLGTIENFIPDENADFEVYLKRLEHVFLLNGVTDDKMKVSALITAGGNICLQKLMAALHSEAVE